MLFSDRPRTHYEKTLAHEVICQLRFPTILSINNVEPADFQERLPSPTTTSSLRTADGS